MPRLTEILLLTTLFGYPRRRSWRECRFFGIGCFRTGRKRNDGWNVQCSGTASWEVKRKNDVSYESKRASGHVLYIRCMRVHGGDNNKRMTAHGKERKKETAFGTPFVRANPRRVEWWWYVCKQLVRESRSRLCKLRRHGRRRCEYGLLKAWKSYPGTRSRDDSAGWTTLVYSVV